MSNVSYRIDQVAFSPRVIEVEVREEPNSLLHFVPQVIAATRPRAGRSCQPNVPLQLLLHNQRGGGIASLPLGSPG